MRFHDRREAGRKLAEALHGYREQAPYVLALPRGGVPVAFEVARALRAPLDLVVARKLGAPGQEELGVGAIAPGGVQVVDERLVRALGITEAQLDEVVRREYRVMEDRARRYRLGRPFPDLDGRTVLLVDDGLATGATMVAALEYVRPMRPRRAVVAVPVAPPSTVAALRRLADEVVAVRTPEGFAAVGSYYRDFAQTSDEEVESLLALAREERAEEGAGAVPGAEV